MESERGKNAKINHFKHLSVVLVLAYVDRKYGGHKEALSRYDHRGRYNSC